MTTGLKSPAFELGLSRIMINITALVTTNYIIYIGYIIFVALYDSYNSGL